MLDLGDNKTVGYNITEYIFYLLKNNSVQNRASYVLFTHYSSNVSLVPTSDISRIASGIGIEKTLRSSKNQNDGSGNRILPIPIPSSFGFRMRLRGKAPYASDSDFASDFVAGRNQALHEHTTVARCIGIMATTFSLVS